MKILFVGLGSIGSRHLRNICRIAAERGMELTIDALRSGHCGDLTPELATLLHVQYDDASALTENYDAAFICNPTALHFQTIRQLADKTCAMFIEKPVFDSCGYDPSMLGLRANGTYYVACPLRYTAVLRYLQEYLKDKRVFSARAICSTYLPDWRPESDYRKVYSAHRDQGGGVSIDLIHEWDYLCWLFGTPQRVCNLQGKYSGLEIDSDDLSLYIAQYPDKLVSLHLDYFGRSARREIELYLRDEVVVGDLRNSEIRFLAGGQTIGLKDERNECQSREIEHFLDILNGIVPNDSTIDTALSTLRIAKGEF